MRVVEKTAIITGATGFIGFHLTKRLLKENWAVHLILRSQSQTAELEQLSGKLEFHRYDGTTESVLKLFQTIKPTIVFHLASLFIAEHQSRDIAALIESNLFFGTQILEGMKLAGTRYLINTGTSWQHFNNQDYSPVCLYAATKQAFEALIQFYAEAHQIKVLTLKLFDTYGPQDQRKKLFYVLNNTLTSQQKLEMSAGEQFLDLVYIDDVIEAYILAVDEIQTSMNTKLMSYAVSSNRPIKLKDLVAMYFRIAQSSVIVDWGKRPYRAREVMVPWSSGAALPGWKARVQLEEGLKKILPEPQP